MEIECLELTSDPIHKNKILKGAESNDIQNKITIVGQSFIINSSNVNEGSNTESVFECILCNSISRKPVLYKKEELYSHVNSRTHILKVLELEDYEAYVLLEDKETMPDEELLNVVMKIESRNDMPYIAVVKNKKENSIMRTTIHKKIVYRKEFNYFGLSSKGDIDETNLDFFYMKLLEKMMQDFRTRPFFNNIVFLTSPGSLSDSLVIPSYVKSSVSGKQIACSVETLNSNDLSAIYGKIKHNKYFNKGTLYIVVTHVLNFFNNKADYCKNEENPCRDFPQILEKKEGNFWKKIKDAVELIYKNTKYDVVLFSIMKHLNLDDIIGKPRPCKSDHAFTPVRNPTNTKSLGEFNKIMMEGFQELVIPALGFTANLHEVNSFYPFFCGKIQNCDMFRRWIKNVVEGSLQLDKKVINQVNGFLENSTHKKVINAEYSNVFIVKNNLKDDWTNHLKNVNGITIVDLLYFMDILKVLDVLVRRIPQKSIIVIAFDIYSILYECKKEKTWKTIATFNDIERHLKYIFQEINVLNERLVTGIKIKITPVAPCTVFEENCSTEVKKRGIVSSVPNLNQISEYYEKFCTMHKKLISDKEYYLSELEPSTAKEENFEIADKNIEYKDTVLATWLDRIKVFTEQKLKVNEELSLHNNLHSDEELSDLKNTNNQKLICDASEEQPSNLEVDNKTIPKSDGFQIRMGPFSNQSVSDALQIVLMVSPKVFNNEVWNFLELQLNIPKPIVVEIDLEINEKELSKNWQLMKEKNPNLFVIIVPDLSLVGKKCSTQLPQLKEAVTSFSLPEIEKESEPIYNFSRLVESVIGEEYVLWAPFFPIMCADKTGVEKLNYSLIQLLLKSNPLIVNDGFASDWLLCMTTLALYFKKANAHNKTISDNVLKDMTKSKPFYWFDFNMKLINYHTFAAKLQKHMENWVSKFEILLRTIYDLPKEIKIFEIQDDSDEEIEVIECVSKKSPTHAFSSSNAPASLNYDLQKYLGKLANVVPNASEKVQEGEYAIIWPGGCRKPTFPNFNCQYFECPFPEVLDNPDKLIRDLTKDQFSAIFLMFDFRMIASRCLSDGCRYFQCGNQNFLVYCHEATVPSLALVNQRLKQAENLVTKLGNICTVILLPLLPFRLYCDDFISLLDHKVFHQRKLDVVGNNTAALQGNRETWKRRIIHLESEWNKMMLKSHTSLPSLPYIQHFIDHKMAFTAVRDSVSELESECSAPPVWFVFVRILLQSLTSHKMIGNVSNFDNIESKKYVVELTRDTQLLTKHNVFLELCEFIEFYANVKISRSLKHTGNITLTFYDEKIALLVTQKLVHFCKVKSWSFKICLLWLKTTDQDAYMLGKSNLKHDAYIDAVTDFITIKHYVNKDFNVMQLYVSALPCKDTYRINKCHKSICGDTHSLMCWNYHSILERRRNPKNFSYTQEYCPYISQNNICPDSDQCSYSHTSSEINFHPLSINTIICADSVCYGSKDKKMKYRQYACPNFHRGSPDIFFSAFWEDMFVHGPHASYDYLMGAMRNANMMQSEQYQNLKILCLSSNEGFLLRAEKLMENFAATIGTRTSICALPNYISEKHHVFLGTPSMISNKNFFSQKETIGVLIVHDMKSIYENKRDWSILKKLIDSIEYSQASVNKVFTSEQPMNNETVANISQKLNLELKVYERNSFYRDTPAGMDTKPLSLTKGKKKKKSKRSKQDEPAVDELPMSFMSRKGISREQQQILKKRKDCNRILAGNGSKKKEKSSCDMKKNKRAEDEEYSRLDQLSVPNRRTGEKRNYESSYRDEKNESLRDSNFRSASRDSSKNNREHDRRYSPQRTYHRSRSRERNSNFQFRDETFRSDSNQSREDSYRNSRPSQSLFHDETYRSDEPYCITNNELVQSSFWDETSNNPSHDESYRNNQTDHDRDFSPRRAYGSRSSERVSNIPFCDESYRSDKPYRNEYHSEANRNNELMQSSFRDETYSNACHEDYRNNEPRPILFRDEPYCYQIRDEFHRNNEPSDSLFRDEPHCNESYRNNGPIQNSFQDEIFSNRSHDRAYRNTEPNRSSFEEEFHRNDEPRQSSFRDETFSSKSHDRAYRNNEPNRSSFEEEFHRNDKPRQSSFRDENYSNFSFDKVEQRPFRDETSNSDRSLRNNASGSTSFFNEHENRESRNLPSRREESSKLPVPSRRNYPVETDYDNPNRSSSRDFVNDRHVEGYAQPFKPPPLLGFAPPPPLMDIAPSPPLMDISRSPPLMDLAPSPPSIDFPPSMNFAPPPPLLGSAPPPALMDLAPQSFSSDVGRDSTNQNYLDDSRRKNFPDLRQGLMRKTRMNDAFLPPNQKKRKYF